MFQTFTVTATPEQGPPRLAALRDEMAARGLDAFLVPRADAHQGEYVAPADARLEWLTGFTGSAGICAVTMTEAGLFVDGRYKVQAASQVADIFTSVEYPKTKPASWLAKRVGAGGRVGFDPWLHTTRDVADLKRKLKPEGVEVVPLADNPVDAIWEDRPDPPRGKVSLWPDKLAGESAADKCMRIAEILRQAEEAAAVLTLPDSICWLLNIRGSDIPRNPVAHGFAILEAETGKLRLFMDAAKLTDVDLGPDVAILPPDSLIASLATMSGSVRVDPATAPEIIGRTLREARIEVSEGDDPCILPKAKKTEAEIAATREAHLRDAAAMCEFLAWLDGEADAVVNGKRVTEIDVVRALEGFRRATNTLKDISFETIAGAGPHGAIVHYRVTEETDRALQSGELLLVDSGGQYLDGTTDITRTVPIGPPGKTEIACFTRVLQGMIAIHRVRWPEGLAGRDLDALARAPLWMAGKDYDHGTGHGVGVFLSVHEGPQRISRLSEVPLEPGMILSNEPGYYREGAFGIRIENLVIVTPAPDLETADPARDMLAFDTLTWVPIDRRLIEVDMLSPGERAWLNAYHAEIARRLDNRVSDAAARWLDRACAPI